jgi:hypothetical protein
MNACCRSSSIVPPFTVRPGYAAKLFDAASPCSGTARGPGTSPFGMISHLLSTGFDTGRWIRGFGWPTLAAWIVTWAGGLAIATRPCWPASDSLSTAAPGDAGRRAAIGPGHRRRRPGLSGGRSGASSESIVPALVVRASHSRRWPLWMRVEKSLRGVAVIAVPASRWPVVRWRPAAGPLRRYLRSCLPESGERCR